MFEPSPEFAKRLKDIETKVKHVRTEAGVERYGKPIGSPIEGGRLLSATTGVVLRAAQQGRGHAEGHMPAMDAMAGNGPHWTAGRPTFAYGQEHIDRTHTNQGIEAQVRSVPYESATAHTIKLTDTVTGRDLGTHTFYGDHSNGAGQMSDAVKGQIEQLTRSAATNLRPAMSSVAAGHFWNYHDGVYGQDWVFGDEPKNAPKYDPRDAASRAWWSNEESKNLGIEVSPSTFMGQKYTLDPNAHESVNATMRVYESAWPGFSALIPQFFVAPQASNPVGSGNWIAYNRPIRPFAYAEQTGYHETHTYEPGSGPLKVNYDHTIIALSSEWFGTNHDIYTRNAEGIHSSSKGNWHAINLDGIQKQTGLQPWEVSMFATLNHEIGHTVARLGTGELGAPGMKYGRDSYQYTFMSNLTDIMHAHGVLDPGTHLWENIDTANGQASDKMTAAAILNTHALEKNLSKYGTSSLHEMMAESWGSYMMDPTPTAFANEVGSLMDENLVQYMADFQKALKAAQKVTK